MRNVSIVIVALCAVVVGCDDSPTSPSPPPTDDTPPPAATFSQVQSQVFNTRCVLHHGDPASGELDLRSPQSYDNLVNVMSPASGIVRVMPGDPDASYLVHKLEGRAGIEGGRMPLGGTPLPEDLMQLIRDWIQDGALNN